jgi:hypothetical protein
MRRAMAEAESALDPRLGTEPEPVSKFLAKRSNKLGLRGLERRLCWWTRQGLNL